MVMFSACSSTAPSGSVSKNGTVKISRAGGTPISPFAFGNNYFNWVDFMNNGVIGINGTEEAVKALHLNVLVGDNNQNDANTPKLFDNAQMDKYIQYCQAVGAEPIMIAPVYGNNVDGGPTSAQGSADIVTYINGTKKYNVQYWTVGNEVDNYPWFFQTSSHYPVSNVSQYIAIYKSYAQAMIEANTAANSSVDLKFVGPELAWQYVPGSDWLTPFLDGCKDYIDVVSIHLYGFAAHELTAEGALMDVDRFRQNVRDLKTCVSNHARPGTAVAITEANICYDWDPKFYTPEQRKVGPGTFYAAIWDADRMGVALEANLWTLAFWELAEAVQMTNGSVFGFLLTDQSKNPPTCILTPEYYAQQMVTSNFSGTTVIPSGVSARMSVFASYDIDKASTAIMVINKNSDDRNLTFMIDNLKVRTINISPMSINIVTIPDNDEADYHLLAYSKQMADAGIPPQFLQ
jgi:alpha-L-arabinofuranosidase